MKKVKGKITSWNDDKGFGFITSMIEDERIFVHIKAFTNRVQRPNIGDIVTYCVSKDTDNRPYATEVSLVGQKQVRDKQSRNNKTPEIVALGFLSALIAVTIISAIPVSLLLVYITLSIMTFILYARDKSAAMRDAWRTPENTLHMFALFGGWPGALIAQNRLRHKSKKQPFRTFFWLTVMMNCVAFAWLLTPEGTNNWKLLTSALKSTLSLF